LFLVFTIKLKLIKQIPFDCFKLYQNVPKNVPKCTKMCTNVYQGTVVCTKAAFKLIKQLFVTFYQNLKVPLLLVLELYERTFSISTPSICWSIILNFKILTNQNRAFDNKIVKILLIFSVRLRNNYLFIKNENTT